MDKVSEALEGKKDLSGKADLGVVHLLERSLEASLSLGEDLSRYITGFPKLTSALTGVPENQVNKERNIYTLIQFKEELEKLYTKSSDELSFTERFMKSKTDPIILGLLGVSTSNAPSSSRLKFPESDTLKGIVEARENAKELPALPLEMLLAAIEKGISLNDLLIDTVAFNLFTVKKEKLSEEIQILGKSRKLEETYLLPFETSKRVLEFERGLSHYLIRYSDTKDVSKNGRLKAAEELLSYTEDFIKLTYSSRLEMNRSLGGEPGNLFMSSVFINNAVEKMEGSLYSTFKIIDLRELEKEKLYHSFSNTVERELNLILLGYSVTGFLHGLKREIDRAGRNFNLDTKSMYKIQGDLNRNKNLIVPPIRLLVMSQKVS